MSNMQDEFSNIREDNQLDKGRRVSELDFSEFAAEFREGDGINPKYDKKSKHTSGKNKQDKIRTRRLCGQIKKILISSLSSYDSELGELEVLSVSQKTSGQPMEVKLKLSEAAKDSPDKFLAKLEHAKSYLNSEIAVGISRKSIPNYKFVLVN